MSRESPLELVYDLSGKKLDKKVANPTRSLMTRILEDAGFEGSWEIRDSKQIKKRGRERFGAIRIESRAGVQSIRVWCKPRGNETAFEYSLLPPQESDIQTAFLALKRVNPITLEVPESPVLPVAFMARAMGMPDILPPPSKVTEVPSEESFEPEEADEGKVADTTGATVSEASEHLLPKDTIKRIKEMISRYEEASKQVSEIEEVLAPLEKDIEAIRAVVAELAEEEERVAEQLNSIRSRRRDSERELEQKEKERSDWEASRSQHAAEVEKIGPILSSIGIGK